MHLFVLGDDNALGSYIELRRERGTVSVPRGRSDDDVDVGQRHRGVAQALASRLRCHGGQPLVEHCRLPESQHIARVFGSDCRLEVFTVIGIVDPADPPEPVVVVGPVAQQRRSDGRERELFAHPVAGIGVAGGEEWTADHV